MKSKLISFILVIVMVLTVLPVGVLAGNKLDVQVYIDFNAPYVSLGGGEVAFTGQEQMLLMPAEFLDDNGVTNAAIGTFYYNVFKAEDTAAADRAFAETLNPDDAVITWVAIKGSEWDVNVPLVTDPGYYRFGWYFDPDEFHNRIMDISTDPAIEISSKHAIYNYVLIDEPVKVSSWDELQQKIYGAYSYRPTTIQLLNDIAADVTKEASGSSIIIGSDKDIIIDLNGHKMDRGLIDGDSCISAISGSALYVEEYGTLTVVDTSGGGIITGGTGTIIGGNFYGGAVYVSGGDFNVYDGAIAGNNANFGGSVYVANSGTFTMSGGAITGNKSIDGGAVYVNNDGIFNMSGGVISDNEATNCGGGVNVQGTFNMEGGVIEYNRANFGTSNTNWGGGGVAIFNNGKATLSSGEIRYNTSSKLGGGVLIFGTSGKHENVTMAGVSIINNTAGTSGGGVCITIDSNDATVMVGGATKITGNVTGGEIVNDVLSGGAINNFYLPSSKKLILGTKTQTEEGNGVLVPTGDKSVGITTETAPTVDNHFAFTTNGSKDDEKYFFSDNEAYAVKYNSNRLELVAAYSINNDAKEANKETNHGYIDVAESAFEDETVEITVYTNAGYKLKSLKYNDGLSDHDITRDATTGKYQFTMPAFNVTITAGFEAIPHVHSEEADHITFTTPWNGGTEHNSMPSDAGSYYLINDITLSDTWNVATGTAAEPKITNLCLNGHVIKVSGDNLNVITVGSNAELNLYDCNSEGQTHYYTYSPTDVWTWNDNVDKTKAITFGGITAGTSDDAIIAISGGAITGGTRNGAAGIYVHGGTFNMYGGNVVGNKTSSATDGDGGGVYLHQGNFNMYGGSIIGNVANGNGGEGGGVYINPTHPGQFTMTGGIIFANTACSSSGGGLAYTNGTVTLGGIAKITGNKLSGGAINNLHLSTGKTVNIATSTEAPKSEMSVGITLANGTGTFTTNGANEIDEKYFFSDNTAYAVKYNNTNDCLELVDAYSITNNTIADDKEKNHGYIEVAESAYNNQIVNITVTPNTGYQLKSLVVSDSSIELASTSATNYVFTMPACNVTVSAIFEVVNLNPPAPSGGGSYTPVYRMPFVDVPKGEYYYDAVVWAHKNKITDGIDATHFDPLGITDRAQMVTFLWRAAGSPQPKTTSCAFTDLDPTSYYYKAVLWAVENGITTGTTATTFEPELNVNRAQTVTFLARYNGVTSVTTTTHEFTDIEPKRYYTNAVEWAYKNKITTGTTETTFSPNDDCQRGQIVTFLYRNFVK